MKFRNHNELSLFAPTLCNHRWQKKRLSIVAQRDYVLDNDPVIQIFELPPQRPQRRKIHTSNQKYRIANKKCEEICTYLSELPENEFQVEMKNLDDHIQRLKGCCNQGKFHFTTIIHAKLIQLKIFHPGDTRATRAQATAAPSTSACAPTSAIAPSSVPMTGTSSVRKRRTATTEPPTSTIPPARIMTRRMTTLAQIALPPKKTRRINQNN